MNRSELTENLAIAVHALRRCEYTYGECVFISEGNPQGIALGIAAKQYGAANVVVGCWNETDADRLTALGFQPYVYGTEPEQALVERETEKRGFQFAFETSGKEAGYKAILEVIKRGAVVGILAKLAQPYTFFVKTAIRSQIRFVGVHSYGERDLSAAEALLKQADCVNALATR